MAYSIQRAVSNGTLNLLDLSINYIERAEISVYFDSILQAPGTTWAWVGSVDKKISFTPNVPNGVEVLVKRTTDLSDLRHRYSAGAAFTAGSVDESLEQVLHIAQEATEVQLGGGFYNDIDMHTYQIKNLGDAVDARDAVPLAQYKADALGAYNSRVGAEAARDTTLAAKDVAVAAKDTAVASRVGAEAARDTTLAAKDVAVAAKDTAVASAQTATAAAQTATTKATEAAQSAQQAAQSAAGLSPVETQTHNAATKSTPVDADELPLADSAATFGLKKLTWGNLKSAIWTALGAGIAGVSAKATPVDADSFAIADSAAGNATKKVTLANLKTIFNGLYMALVAPGNSGNILTSNGSAWTSAAPTASGVTSVNGNTGTVTAAQVAAAATTGYGYTPANPANTATKDVGHNAVGSFCLVVYNTTSTAAPGSTFAGSALQAMGFARGGDGNGVYMTQTGSALSGTWRILGYFSNVSALADGYVNLTRPATLAQRIS